MFRTRKAIVGMNRKLIEYAVLLFPMSFALCTSYGTGGVLAVKPYDPVRIIALILLGVLLWKTVQNGAVSARTSSSSICASAIIALVLTIGQPLAESDGFVFSTISFEQGIQYGLNSAVLAAIYALIFIGNFAWVWSAVSTLFFTLDNGPHGNRGDNAVSAYLLDVGYGRFCSFSVRFPDGSADGVVRITLRSRCKFKELTFRYFISSLVL